MADEILADCEVVGLDGVTAVSASQQRAADCAMSASQLNDAAQRQHAAHSGICSELQVAVVTACLAACKTCDIADTDTVLSSCMVENPPGSGAMERGAEIIYDCKAETLHEADNQCTAVQQAVYNHVSQLNCGSYDATVADEILADCLTLSSSGGSLTRASALLAIGCFLASSRPQGPSPESMVVVVTYHVVPVATVPFLDPPPAPAPALAPHVTAHQHSNSQGCTGPPPTLQDGRYTVQFGGTHATLRCNPGFVASTAGQTIFCTSNVWNTPGGCAATKRPAAVASATPLRGPVASKQTNTVSHADQTSTSEGSSVGHAVGSVFAWIGACVIAAFIIAYGCSELSTKNRSSLLRDRMQKMRASDWNRDPEDTRDAGSIYEPQSRGTVMWSAPAPYRSLSGAHGSN